MKEPIKRYNGNKILLFTHFPWLRIEGSDFPDLRPTEHKARRIWEQIDTSSSLESMQWVRDFRRRYARWNGLGAA